MRENSDSVQDADAFTFAFPLSELPPGKARAETIGTYSIGFFNIDGTIYAIDDDCPHQDGPLHSGPVDVADKTVTCPLHHWCFRLTDGMLSNGRRSVATFDVKISDGNVLVSPTPRPAATPGTR